MTVEERLEAEGFVHHVSDEPHEDHWILESGIQPDLLVEKDGRGWCLYRTPVDGEFRGQWVDIAAGLGEEACISAVDAFLAGKCPSLGQQRSE